MTDRDDTLKARYDRANDALRHAQKVFEECEIEIDVARNITRNADDLRTQSRLRNDAVNDIHTAEKEIRSLKAEREINRLFAGGTWPWAYKGDDKPAEKPQSLMSRFRRRVTCRY